jgi:transposase|tara:strand:+ start:76 stop:888 length:813 start_codon:yes stop_codon:yes gene_type:complete
MKKRKTIVNKVKHLLKKSGLPTYLHRKGPKRFCFWQLCLGLMVKEIFRLSYRRAALFLKEFYGIELHWTTLQKCRKRVPLSVWQKLLQLTTDDSVQVAAIDGTGLQRSNPSAHYLWRIDSDRKVTSPIMINFMVDVIRKKFLSVKHHIGRAGEVADVPYLIDQSHSEIDLILMDKAYDSEKLHRYLREQGIYSIAPVKKNWARGQLRKQLKDCFDYALYWQRNIIESLFSALKRLFGSLLHSRSARTQRAELYMRLIAYNLRVRIKFIFY